MLPSRKQAESILIVDDEPQVMTAIADALEDDFRIITETSPAAALKILEQTRDIAVILCDQRMPKMTGDQLLAQAKGICAATRVLITGFADMEAVIDAVNEGNIFGYISKPWDIATLKLMIEKAAQYHIVTRELNHEKALLHNLMAYSPDAIHFKDLEHCYQRLNQAEACMVLGIDTPQKAIGKMPSEFVASDIAQLWTIEEKKILTTGVPLLNRQWEATGQDGKIRWVSASKAAIRDQRGEVIGLVGITRDVTERKLSQQALEESEKRLRLILDSTAEAIFGVDQNGNCTFCNSACLTFLGHDHQVELHGHDMHRLLHPECNNVHDAGATGEPCELARFLRRGTANHLEHEVLYRKDRSSFEAELWSHPVESYDGTVGSVLTFFDITNQKEMERQLHHAQRMEAVGQLTGGIAHDFNNLLTVIIGNLDLVAENVDIDSGVKELNQRALSAAERSAELTGQLLAFSRRQSLRPRTIDVRELIDEASKLMDRTLGEDIELRKMIAPDIWAIKADPAQLQSALLNLAVNARDAMPGGGVLSIEAKNVTLNEFSGGGQETRGDYILLSVTDTGRGMSKEILDRVFEPFFTTKEPGKGTGLGLSMVYGFLQQSGGFTKVESEVGVGTMIHLYLPRHAEQEIASEIRSTNENALTSRSAKVLIVEDNDLVRQTIIMQLKSPGFTTRSAASGPEAIDILRGDADIDVLLTDVVMHGGMSGPELADQARRIAPNLTVIYTTGFERDKDSVYKIPDNGILLRKPFNRQKLRTKIQEALSKKK